MNLNQSQLDVVHFNSGPMMVLAGAGSGKTRTLVTKIRYLIEEERLSPYQVLALTFSNKAAKEMRSRIAADSKIDIGAYNITTFHSFSAKVLRSEANYIGLSKNFTIFDGTESKTLVKNILAKHGFSIKEINPYDVQHYIEKLKNSGLYLGHPKLSEHERDEFFPFYRDYEQELANSNATDFGGLITGVLQLLEHHEEVRRHYQNKFKYILIDEYQDTNRAQFELLLKLSEKVRGVCVVGDEDQSIYSWRGADINNILDFEKYFANSKLYKLEQNFRSTKNIIEAASYVIDHNIQRKGKRMWTENLEGSAIKVIELVDEKSEAEYITKEIDALVNRQSVSANDIAVFYRTNSQSRILEDYLRRKNIAYQIIGGMKFYERKEIKDLIAYLRLIFNSKDSLAFSRIINTPSRGVGAVTLRKIEDAAQAQNLSLYEIVGLIVRDDEIGSEIKVSKRVKSTLAEFYNLIEEAVLLSSKNGPLIDILRMAMHNSGYLESLKINRDIETLARLENIQEFENAVISFSESFPEAGLSQFLESITLDTSEENSDEPQEDKGLVSLMTIHGAKGLEFPHVYICGCEENVFPSYRSLEEDGGNIEEERRLFYVGMTRAMKKLSLTYCQGRMLFGQTKFNGPSRFIEEIPESFIERVHLGKKSYQSFNDNYSDDDFNQESQADFDDYQYVSDYEKSYTYQSGMAISHQVYGNGIVISSEGRGKEEKVLIKFKDGAKKKFLVQFAPLSTME
jgi:DNA helicase-2/ATP-dependent DNA helicase PcrA